MTDCPDREMLARFVAGTASPAERRLIVRHLLAGCVCAGGLRSVFRPAVAEGAYDGLLARWLTWARDRELLEVGSP